jgi:hypothetical protein
MASKRQRSSTETHVLDQLRGRKLKTLADCRLAWEHAGDPLAVCVAITKTEMPEWLADALLALLFVGAQPKRSFLQRLWARKDQNARDAKRAWEVVKARAHPEHQGPGAAFTWEEAYQLGEYLSRTPESPRTTPASAKKSYALVSRRLEENPGLYYVPVDGEALAARIRLAALHLVEIMEQEIGHRSTPSK